MKKRPRHATPQSPSPSQSPSSGNPQSAIRNPQSAIRNPQSDIPHSAIRNPQSSWRPTLLLIGSAWVVLLLCALLWQFWTGRALLVYFAAAVIGICFTLAALFERIYNRNL